MEIKSEQTSENTFKVVLTNLSKAEEEYFRKNGLGEKERQEKLIGELTHEEK